MEKRDYFNKNYSTNTIKDISKYLDDIKEDDIKLMDIIDSFSKSEHKIFTGTLMENYLNTLNKAFNDKINSLSVDEAEALYRFINYRIGRKENENNLVKNSLKNLEEKEQALFDKIAKNKKKSIISSVIIFILSGAILTTVIGALSMFISIYMYSLIFMSSLISACLVFKYNPQSPSIYDEDFREILDEKSHINKIEKSNNNSLDFMYNFRRNINEEIKDKKKKTFNNKNLNDEYDIEKVKRFYNNKK